MELLLVVLEQAVQIAEHDSIRSCGKPGLGCGSRLRSLGQWSLASASMAHVHEAQERIESETVFVQPSPTATVIVRLTSAQNPKVYSLGEPGCGWADGLDSDCKVEVSWL